LARRYKAVRKPVLFLEHNVDSPQGNRQDRWYDAYPGDAYVPMAMVDSGFRASSGWVDFEPVYRSMVNDALERPAGADVHAWYERSDNDLSVTARVTNWSGSTLSDANKAAVNVLVYEDNKVIHTERFVRAAEWIDITSPLLPGETGTYVVELVDVKDAQWHLAHVIVLVDYRPDPGSMAYDMLQAAEATPGVPPTATPTTTITPTPEGTLTPTPTIVVWGEPLFIPFCAAGH